MFPKYEEYISFRSFVLCELRAVEHSPGTQNTVYKNVAHFGGLTKYIKINKKIHLKFSFLQLFFEERKTKYV